VAEQAGVRALGLAEAHGHLRIGDDLVRARTEASSGSLR
jgi:hypothetical protein